MKQIILSEEEARVVAKTLKNSGWVPLADQKIVYDVISKIERELVIE